MSGITDLEAGVKEWAKKQKSLGIKNANKARVEVNWQRVKFTPDNPDWTKANQVPVPPNVTIYSTTFENWSDKDTEHTLTMERATKATSKTTVTKGYTTSLNFGLSLSLPKEVAKATFDFGREVRVDTGSETTVEQDQRWSVDTKVCVPSMSKTKVRVEVIETRWKGTFKLPVTIKGTIIANLYDQNTPGNHLGTVEADVRELLPELGAKSVSGSKAVKWDLEGESDFVFGVEQKVVVEPEALLS